jgi:hypothetical protein
LDDSIEDTFVSSVLEEVSFCLDRFSGQLQQESRIAQEGTHGNRYESMGDTIVQLRGPFCSG